MITVRPTLLQADNVTPPTRTPWGGTRLGDRLKPSLRGQTVGEAWELSVEPDFPSHVGSAEGPLLDEVIRANPEPWLGREYELGRPSTALLVKLLDTQEPLSVQIHPTDNAPFLGPDESGKPESWYVLDREPGAGLFLGLRESTTREQLETAIRDSGAVEQLLNFVPVDPGDFFLIEAGTPHAIGAGITLVEPQRVLPGRRGVTYRYWDWNRLYDREGQPSKEGKPRDLHLDAALSVTGWETPRGSVAIDAVRRCDRPDVEGPASRRSLAGAELASEFLRVDRLSGTGDLPFQSDGHLWALTVVGGHAVVRGPDRFELRVPAGRTAALPARFTGSLELERCLAIASAAL